MSRLKFAGAALVVVGVGTAVFSLSGKDSGSSTASPPPHSYMPPASPGEGYAYVLEFEAFLEGDLTDFDEDSFRRTRHRTWEWIRM